MLRKISLYFICLVSLENVIGQKVSIKTDSSTYHFTKGSPFQLVLQVENNSNQKVRLQGLINEKIDSFLYVYPYADTYFSKIQKNFVHFGCKVDIDPISGWIYKVFHNSRFLVKAPIPFDCLEHVGYFKLRLYLGYQLGNDSQWKTAVSNWFIIKVVN